MNIKIILILNFYFLYFTGAQTVIKDESVVNNFNSTPEEFNSTDLSDELNETSLELNENESKLNETIIERSVEILNEISSELNETDSSTAESNSIDITTEIFNSTLQQTSTKLPNPIVILSTSLPIPTEITSTTTVISISNENIFDKFNPNKDIHFRLYNTQTYCQNVPEIILNNKESIFSSNFNPTLPTRFLIHDWDSYSKCEFTMMVKDAYLSQSNQNIIIVDWEKASLVPYQQAQNNSIQVGQMIGKFIDFLYKDGNLNLSDVYLIGFGLGAHIAGIAGRSLQYNNKISVIYGLDPTQLRTIIFEKPSKKNKKHLQTYSLRKTDGKYVEIIYTSQITTSILQEPAGHSNFYINLGTNQPGCDLNLSCGHARAYRYFAESIISEKGFIGIPCRSYREIILSSICRRVRTPMGIMGGKVANRFNLGIFNVPVKSRPPHAIGIY